MTTLGHRILLQVQGFWKRKLRYLGTEITDTINLDNKERVGDCTAVEKAVAPHSSTLAWKIPWTEELDRLQFVGLQRVGPD